MRTIRATLRFAAFVFLTFGIYALWWTGALFVSDEKPKINWQIYFAKLGARLCANREYEIGSARQSSAAAVSARFKSFKLYGHCRVAFGGGMRFRGESRY